MRARVYVCVSAGPALGGAGPKWEQFRSAQVPSQLAPRSVVGSNWPSVCVFGGKGCRHKTHT